MNTDNPTDENQDLVAAIINAVTTKSELPEGVEIVDKVEVDNEIKTVFGSIKDNPEFAEDLKMQPDYFEFEVKQDYNGLMAIEPYTLVTDAKEHGIVSLPKLIIVFKLNGEMQIINSALSWFIFSTLDLADQIVLETQEIIEDLLEEKPNEGA